MKDIIIKEYTEQYLEACLSVALKLEQVYQRAYAETLGNEIYSVAMGNWKEDLETEVKKTLTEQYCFLAFQGDRLVGFAGYRQVRHIGVISQYAVDPAEDITVVLPKLILAAFDEMKKMGVTHVMANCGMDEVHNNDRKAFEAAGFEIYLPHVRYYQVLGEGTTLPETQVQIVPCKPEHIADCSRIAVQVWEGIHDAYIEYQGKELHDAISGSWRESKAREVAEQQSNPEGVVALVDGKVAGFCGYRLKDDKMAILGFNGVDP